MSAPNANSATRTPREVARGLAAKWHFLQDLQSAPASELSQRRDTLLALQAQPDGTRGKFPGTAYLESVQTELAQRTRRRLALLVGQAQDRRRPAAGPYSAHLEAVRADYQPPKHHLYA